jgi:hypothetical protein
MDTGERLTSRFDTRPVPLMQPRQLLPWTPDLLVSTLFRHPLPLMQPRQLLPWTLAMNNTAIKHGQCGCLRDLPIFTAHPPRLSPYFP